MGAGIQGLSNLPVFGLTTDPHPIWTLFLWKKMSDKINNLVTRRGELMDELNQITREIEDAQTEVFRHIASQKILVQRYFEGDSVIVSFNRFWWINQDGDLLGMVDESDILELKELTNSGIFERITH